MGKKKMYIPEVLKSPIRYVPAQVHITPSKSVVRYYVINPSTDKLHKKEVRLDRVHSVRLRRQWGLQLAQDINIKLSTGWNPFYEQLGRLAHSTAEEAVASYIEYKKRDLRPATMVSYVSLSNKLLEWWKKNKATKYIIGFTSYDAQKILDDVYYSSRNITPRTYNNYLKLYRTLFEWFVERDYIKINPFDTIKTKRVNDKKRVIIPKKIREQIKEHLSNDPFYYVCELVYKCFLRPKEISMLQIKHIDYDNQIMVITSDVSKNHKERYVPIPDTVFAYLKTLRYDRDYYIFSTRCYPTTISVDPRYYTKRWAKLREALNLPTEYQLYSLKDTGITEMLEAGVPAKLVQELADHHSLEMTQKYVHKSNVKEILKYDVLNF